MLNVIGTIFGITGYDSHTRSLINALYKLIDVRLSTQLYPGWERLCNDAELNMITKQGKDNEDTLIITTPHNWKMYTGLGKNYGYCIWEGDNVPKSFIDDFLNPKINLIIVASEHTKQAIMNTTDNKDILDKIRVVNHGVDRSLFYNLHLPKDNIFRFVCNKGWRGTNWDRGGVQYLLKAFNEEFTKDENVELTVKLNPAYINPQDLQQSIKNLNLKENGGRIHITVSNIPPSEINKLYNNSNVFVCATRCEAFNLPGLEAMSCGLPTIQTNFGGQTDYMNLGNSWGIDYKLEEVKEDLMYEGIKWATPDIEILKLKMRFCYEHQQEVKERGQQAEEDSKNFTWEHSAKKMVEYISF